ncbi:hypothetical protein [Nodosilinea sp. LEGE 07298]
MGLLLVGRETPLDPKALPGQCPFSLEQLFSDKFPENLDSL